MENAFLLAETQAQPVIKGAPGQSTEKIRSSAGSFFYTIYSGNLCFTH